jgi:hypothetical protein
MNKGFESITLPLGKSLTKTKVIRTSLTYKNSYVKSAIRSAEYEAQADI